MADRLQHLRRQLGSIDREFLTLAARRRDLAREIGRIKQERGLATRDFERERVVLSRACALASELGLSQELARELTASLIRSALTAQERDRVTVQGRGDGRKALVIGGAGGMGSWLVRFLSSQGFSVEVADPGGSLAGFRCVGSHRELELDHDFVAVSVPIRQTGAVLTELATRRPRGVVFDLASLKGPVRAGLSALRAVGVRVASLHPMFGPDTHLLSGRHVIFCNAGVPEATAELRSLFSATMAILVDMELETHDRQIAFVLGLSHALNVAFFTALRTSQRELPHLDGMSSTTFDAQLYVARRVSADNPHLYFDIQTLNQFNEEALDALERAVRTFRETVRKVDEEEFIGLMESGRLYLGAGEKEA